ncbi:MAG: DUF6444 domain-containing protein [Actinomycetota bacterium]|nr:DUF6444 domain-containing protein [Actinomycetota bacterium]
MNAALRAKVEELAAAVGELRARLERNAKNSSLPPSSEGLGKKPVQPRTRGGRRGKQPGTPGTHLAQVAQPDRVSSLIRSTPSSPRSSTMSVAP